MISFCLREEDLTEREREEGIQREIEMVPDAYATGSRRVLDGFPKIWRVKKEMFILNMELTRCVSSQKRHPNPGTIREGFPEPIETGSRTIPEPIENPSRTHPPLRLNHFTPKWVE